MTSAGWQKLCHLTPDLSAEWFFDFSLNCQRKYILIFCLKLCCRLSHLFLANWFVTVYYWEKYTIFIVVPKIYKWIFVRWKKQIFFPINDAENWDLTQTVFDLKTAELIQTPLSISNWISISHKLGPLTGLISLTVGTNWNMLIPVRHVTREKALSPPFCPAQQAHSHSQLVTECCLVMRPSGPSQAHKAFRRAKPRAPCVLAWVYTLVNFSHKTLMMFGLV